MAEHRSDQVTLSSDNILVDALTTDGDDRRVTEIVWSENLKEPER